METRPDIPVDLALCLYRLAQECLSNVVKDAEASEAVVRLWRGEGERLTLDVRVNGAGLVQQTGKGLGLVGLRERVARFGGEFSLEEVARSGLAVKCTFLKT